MYVLYTCIMVKFPLPYSPPSLSLPSSPLLPPSLSLPSALPLSLSLPYSHPFSVSPFCPPSVDQFVESLHLLVFIVGVSPVLKTLTQSISTDTVWLMTV